jgi:hypothetical protein
MGQVPEVPEGVDTGVPTPARIYDYMPRGGNYFDTDRRAAASRQVSRRARDR